MVFLYHQIWTKTLISGFCGVEWQEANQTSFTSMEGHRSEILIPRDAVALKTDRSSQSATRLCLKRSKTATTTGAEIINKACAILGWVSSGNIMLPYFIAAAPATEPAPNCSKYFTSSWETNAALSSVLWSLWGLEDARSNDNLLYDVVRGWTRVPVMDTKALFGWNDKIEAQFLEIGVAKAAAAAIDLYLEAY